MISRIDLERLLAENNFPITVDKLLSEYRGKTEISIFVHPWTTESLIKKI